METRTVRLGDFATFVNEKCYLNEASRNTYVSTENLKPNRLGVFFPITKLPQTNKVNTFAKGDILIANIRPYFKKIWHANIAGTHSTDVLNIRSNSKQLLQSYLAVVLSDDRFFDYMMATSKGTKMPRGDKKAIMDFKFELPSFKDQIIVSDSISVINQKIELNRQINKNLLRLCRIQFDRVKLACSSTTDLSNIAVLMMGQSPKGNTYNQKGEGTPLLNGAADFRGGINPSKYTSDPKKVTKPGDYVFGIRATIGLTTKVFDCYAIGRGTGLARSLNSEFDELLYFILEDSFDYFAHAATGSVYLNISRKDFETYSAPAFSGHSQKVFHDFASPLMEKIYQDETQNKKLTQIRDILLPKLLSGSVDLSGIEEAMKNA
ncbi:restriction endonuclease subunit S [Secundilactobacillus paracollinoides]|nr:restriction endonuclease subunit S [Secundilactobacillus paracollinoides]